MVIEDVEFQVSNPGDREDDVIVLTNWTVSGIDTLYRHLKY
jgi:hypothetical protein